MARLRTRQRCKGLPEPVQLVVADLIRTQPPGVLEEFVEERDAANDGTPPLTLTGWFQVCRRCGCTDEHGCAEACSWVEEDLCSSCTDGDSDGITEDALEPAEA